MYKYVIFQCNLIIAVSSGVNRSLYPFLLLYINQILLGICNAL